MKKIVLGAIILGIITPTSSYAMKGEFTFSTEAEDFTSPYENEDFILPEIGLKLYPHDDSPLSFEGTFSYRCHRDHDERRADSRKRYQFYTGYSWGLTENLVFSPKMGIRHESYAREGELGSSGDDERMQFRFYPNTSCKINDEWRWYLSGFVAPVKTDYKGTRDADESTSSSADYTDYLHELESGFKYKLAPNHVFTLAVYSEYEQREKEASQEEWQFRVKYEYTFGNDGKTKISPWARIGLYREQKRKIDKATRDKKRHRFGINVSHNITDNFTVFGEAYYQTEKAGNYHVSRGDDIDKMFYKLGFRQKF